MGVMVDSLLWVVQDLDHQPYQVGTWFRQKPPALTRARNLAALGGV